MNAPLPTPRRILYSRRLAAPARSAQHSPPIVTLAHDLRRAANEETATTVAEHSVNPLWMITAALALFFAAMAAFV